MTTPASPIDPVHTGHEHGQLPCWHRGRVAWFDTAKGFGFLTPTGGPAVFVDFKVIDMPGYKCLTAGQSVIYTATDTPRGPEATRVIPYPHSAHGHSEHHEVGRRIGRRQQRGLAPAA
ncbi:cold-shock protein [Nocardia sp. NPDC050406]|uniref:cold-shock protein n=1 Tax=Nocardia sp. NPDC050406 TaxID=3364318 RepID=UPI0037B89067